MRLNLNYPTNGVGAIVTYLEVTVEQVRLSMKDLMLFLNNNLMFLQTSNVSNAYIINGGIGQRYISVVVEASNTLVFNHKSLVFGLN